MLRSLARSADLLSMLVSWSTATPLPRHCDFHHTSLFSCPRAIRTTKSSTSSTTYFDQPSNSEKTWPKPACPAWPRLLHPLQHLRVRESTRKEWHFVARPFRQGTLGATKPCIVSAKSRIHTTLPGKNSTGPGATMQGIYSFSSSLESFASFTFFLSL